MYKEIFPERIKKARKDTGFTQIEVSKELDISRSCIGKYENGQLEPNIENLGKLAEFYDISIDWLFGLSHKNKSNKYNQESEHKKMHYN